MQNWVQRQKVPHQKLVAFFMAWAFLAGCDSKQEVWIYTSFSREILEELVEPLQTAVPDAEVHWFQGSSEEIAARVQADDKLGKWRADLVISGDPVWWSEQKRDQRWLHYSTDAVQSLPASDRDADLQFVAVRKTLAVLATLDRGDAKGLGLPETWREITQPKWTGMVSMSMPFESTLAWYWISQTSQAWGWEYLAELKKQRTVVEGTQNSVLQRVQSGERPLGVLPLEAVYRRKMKWIQPKDLLIMTPTYMGIVRESEELKVVQKIYDWLLTPAAQTILVAHGSIPVISGVALPQGTSLSIPQKLGEDLLPSKNIKSIRERTLAKFSEVFFH